MIPILILGVYFNKGYTQFYTLVHHEFFIHYLVFIIIENWQIVAHAMPSKKLLTLITLKNFINQRRSNLQNFLKGGGIYAVMPL